MSGHPNAHHAAGRVLVGIGEEVCQHQQQLVAVAVEQRHVIIDAGHELGAPRGHTLNLQGLLDHPPDVELLGHQLNRPSRIDPGHVQEAVDEAGQVVGRLDDGAQGLDRRLFEGARAVEEGGLRVALDGGYGRPELVGGEGDERIPELVNPSPLDGIANRALQQRRVDLALDEVVRGACFHGLEVDIVVALTGGNDDGGFAAALDSLLEQLQAGVAAKTVVNEVDVMFAALDDLEPLLVGGHPVELEPCGLRGLCEHVARHDEVVLVVVDHEYSDRSLIHPGPSSPAGVARSRTSTRR